MSLSDTIENPKKGYFQKGKVLSTPLREQDITLPIFSPEQPTMGDLYAVPWIWPLCAHSTFTTPNQKKLGQYGKRK